MPVEVFMMFLVVLDVLLVLGMMVLDMYIAEGETYWVVLDMYIAEGEIYWVVLDMYIAEGETHWIVLDMYIAEGEIYWVVLDMYIAEGEIYWVLFKLNIFVLENLDLVNEKGTEVLKYLNQTWPNVEREIVRVSSIDEAYTELLHHINSNKTLSGVPLYHIAYICIHITF